MNGRLVARRLIQMAGGIVGALVVAEIALRLMRLAPAEGIATVTAREYDRLPGIYTPNQHIRDLQRPELPFTVSIDSLGFRGADFSRDKPAGQWRMVMFGDSYVYGDFVDDEQTFPAQLEQRLRKSCPQALVINAGLGGTTIVDHAFMMQRALALHPDVVIQVYVVDDFDNLGDPVSSWEHLADNRARKSRFPLSIIYPWARNTALWNLMVKARATRLNRQDAVQLQQQYTNDRAHTSNRLRELYGTHLLAMRDTLQAHGVRLVFAMFPWSKELQGARENLVWMEQFAKAQRLDAVNILPALQATHWADTTLYLLPKDGHPSPTGYGIAADTLATQLLAAAPSSCKAERRSR